MQPPLIFDPISSNENLDETVLDLVQPGLTVFAGPMFSGKSRMLINAIDSVGSRFNDVRERPDDPASLVVADYIAAFVPSNDTRSDRHAITSRGFLETEISYPASALPPTEPWRMLEAQYHDKPFVFIDEGNFWGYFSESGAFVKRAGLKETVQMLVEQGREVYVGGLGADFRNEPFAEMGDLLAIADRRPQLYAWQGKHETASRTQRIVSGRPARYTDPVFLVGDTETYSARSAEMHRVPDKRAHLIKSIKGYLSEEMPRA